MTKQPLYLDYASTTPADARVVKAMMACLEKDGNFANPASRTHVFGWQAEAAVEGARRQVADLISADPREIVWTSGATESNNLAIKGAVSASGFLDKAFSKATSAETTSPGNQGFHIVTAQTEHKAVLDTVAYIEKQGVKVTYVRPKKDGKITASLIEDALRDDTKLVSVMHINNETGVINDIEGIGNVCKDRGIVFHVDAAQSAGKISVNVNTLNIDLMSISAHKMYGPKGVGALFVRRAPHVSVNAQIHGGGHERGMRSGTLATHQLVGFGLAAQIAQESFASDYQKFLTLNKRFIKGIKAIDGVAQNGDADNAFPAIINLRFDGIDGEQLLMSLRDLAISSGSACTSASVDPSYVLMAMGLSKQLAQSSLRFSFGRDTTQDDIDFTLSKINTALNSLRTSNISKSYS